MLGDFLAISTLLNAKEQSRTAHELEKANKQLKKLNSKINSMPQQALRKEMIER